MFLKNQRRRRFRRNAFRFPEEWHVKRVAVYIDVVQTDKTFGASMRARKRCSFPSRGAWKQWPGGYKTKYVHACIRRGGILPPSPRWYLQIWRVLHVIIFGIVGENALAGAPLSRERVAFSFVQSPIVRKFGFDAGRRVDLGRRTRRAVVDHLARWILYGREKISRRVCRGRVSLVSSHVKFTWIRKSPGMWLTRLNNWTFFVRRINLEFLISVSHFLLHSLEIFLLYCKYSTAHAGI